MRTSVQNEGKYSFPGVGFQKAPLNNAIMMLDLARMSVCFWSEVMY